MTQADALYFEYLRERQGINALSCDHGFVTYRFNEVGQKKECFLVDMYVAREARQSGLGTKLVNQLAELALGAGCDCISANIHLDLPGANVALKGAMSLGFEVERSQSNVLLIVLKLKGD